MSRLDKEWEVKLELLRSIARSQEALARILESVADVTAGSEPAASAMREHVRKLADLQAALVGAVTGQRWSAPRKGVPSPPWGSRGRKGRTGEVKKRQGGLSK
ncbi:hypothetical protein [Cohnella fermenti]|uniref:Uncharacterized protein n=1 Tax=Cohnella fermenti TaxID=2565925 RepID=A0A4S4BG27_9BACL|nr:hypothetical protein [Cohnella fermenti]THF73360.1 hypothetical protein E6C55_29580 [Cohnella fermenti]